MNTPKTKLLPAPKLSRFFTSTVALIAIALNVNAQKVPAGITRVELQRYDVTAPGTEAVQVRIDFAPGSAFGNHNHPGEELIYVLKGKLEYVLKGKPPVILSAGQVLFIPSGAIHSARNVGKEPASELATYIVKKGEPLVKPEN